MGGKVYHSRFRGKRAGRTRYLGRKHAIFQTSFTSHVLRCCARPSGAFAGFRGASRLTWQAAPRWFRRCYEQSECSKFSRRQQQGHARRAPEKYQEGSRKTLRTRGSAKDRGGKNRFDYCPFAGDAQEGRRDRKVSETNQGSREGLRCALARAPVQR